MYRACTECQALQNQIEKVNPVLREITSLVTETGMNLGNYNFQLSPVSG